MKIFELENRVIKALAVNKECRENDHMLYVAVCEDIVGGELNNFLEMFTNRKAYELPPFESVSRCRRRVQAQYPELQSRERIAKMRDNKQLDYIDYAINNNNIDI